MQHAIIGALEIIGVCLLIALAAIVLVVFRPAARRRRRRRRHKQQPRIDLFAPSAQRDASPDPDA